MYSNFPQPCSTEPTRVVQRNRPSLIYNIFINIIDKNLYSGNLLDKLTDHLPNFVIIENMNKKPSKQKMKMRGAAHFTLDKYLADLKDLDSVLLQEFSNVNDIYNIYQDRLVEIIDKNLPFKVLSKKESKLKLKPWIAPGILKSIKTKNKIYRKFLRSRRKF